MTCGSIGFAEANILDDLDRFSSCEFTISAVADHHHGGQGAATQAAPMSQEEVSARIQKEWFTKLSEAELTSFKGTTDWKKW